ncbi:MAG: alpha/beta hydrolase [Actinomycetota bacterium]
MEEFTRISLQDGRELEVRVSGPENGLPLVFHHGTPGAATPLRALDAAAASRGMRLIVASRAGYGGSTRHPGRRVIDVVDDTNAILDALGVDDCVVAGWSGGGPHALACAAQLDRTLATLVIAGVGPFGVPDLTFLAGMGQDNIDEFGAALEGEEELRSYLEAQRPGLRAATAEGIVESLRSILPKIDQDVLTDEFGADLADSFHEALRVSVDGWLDDDLAFITPWGFSLDDISVPVSLWQGDLDLMVPYAHGEWLGRNIPNVKATLRPGDGHLSILLGALDGMLDELVDAARR